MELFNVGISVPKKPGDLYYVFVTDETGTIIKKIYKGINKFDSDTDRMAACAVTKKQVELELSLGWNPKASKSVLPQPYNRFITVLDAYDKALNIIEESDKSDSTKKDYKSHHKYFTQAVLRLKWKNVPFADLDQYHFTLILEDMIKARKNIVENAYFNKHLEIIKSFSSTLKNAFIIKENKAHGIPERKHNKQRREILTPEEQTTVISHFQKVRPTFITFLKVLYHLGIREKEMMMIKCGMIDTTTWTFHLPEDITKNGKNGVVLIPPDIQSDLQKFDLSNPDYYLFGISQNRSKWAEQFIPSPYMMARSTGTRLWKNQVKDQLKIDKDLYSLKHKGANDKLRSGMPFNVVSNILRHSGEKITEIYATQRNIIEQEQNIEKHGTFE